METKNKKIANMDLKQYGMFLILIGIFILFAITTKGANAKPVNINNVQQSTNRFHTLESKPRPIHNSATITSRAAKIAHFNDKILYEKTYNSNISMSSSFATADTMKKAPSAILITKAKILKTLFSANRFIGLLASHNFHLAHQFTLQ